MILVTDIKFREIACKGDELMLRVMDNTARRGGMPLLNPS